MEIICIASSSAGNAYLVKGSSSNMVIECGIPFRQLRTAIVKNGIIPSRICVAAVSHGHGDHAVACEEMSTWAPLFASAETLAGVKNRYTSRPRIAAKPWLPYQFGGFQITAFPLDHDCEGTLGFIVREQDTDETLLFVNDTRTVKWDFCQYAFDYVMIECNYVGEIMAANENADIVRRASSHMSLEATKAVLAKLNREKTKWIWLMHLSDGNSDEACMIREVEELTGVPTYACQKDGGVRR